MEAATADDDIFPGEGRDRGYNDWRRWDACRGRQDDTREGLLLVLGGGCCRARRGADGAVVGALVTWASRAPLSLAFCFLLSPLWARGTQARPRDRRSPPVSTAAGEPAGDGMDGWWPGGGERESPAPTCRRAPVSGRAT